jgi:hypothetical protein
LKGVIDLRSSGLKPSFIIGLAQFGTASTGISLWGTHTLTIEISLTD